MKVEAKKAFVAMYDELAPKVFTFCFYRVRSKELAEDLTSQAFIRAWDYVRSGNSIEKPKTFLYRVANNLIVDHYRATKHSYKDVSLDDPNVFIDVPESANIEANTDVKLAMSKVTQHLESLEEPYRTIVVLRYMHDLTIQEIAEVTDISENNVSVRLHRAIDKLRKLTTTEI